MQMEKLICTWDKLIPKHLSITNDGPGISAEQYHFYLTGFTVPMIQEVPYSRKRFGSCHRKKTGRPAAYYYFCQQHYPAAPLSLLQFPA